MKALPPLPRDINGCTPTAIRQYVRIPTLSHTLRFEVDSTPHPYGAVWLRPAFVAIAVDPALIEPWPEDEPCKS